MIKNPRIWVETQASFPSQLQEPPFTNSNLNLRISRYQSFLVLAKVTSFSYFLPNILSVIVEAEES